MECYLRDLGVFFRNRPFDNFAVILLTIDKQSYENYMAKIYYISIFIYI